MTNLESALSRALKERSLQEVAERNMTPNELAQTLNVLEDGARRLISSDATWSVDKGLRVAAALGLTMSFDIAGVKVQS